MRDSDIFIPALNANLYANNSHDALSILSFLEGNFAIHKFLELSVKFAFGLAPPNDDPGAISINIHFLIFSSFSSDSIILTASSSSPRIVQGGVVVLDLVSKNGPLGSNLNLNAPILLSS